MKVLVVDDDAGSLLVAQVVIEQAGHDCVTAVDGDDAWTIFQEQRPEVVVTDWMMPGLDGLALCRAIRKAEKDSYTYLILLTSSGSHSDVLRGMAAGADDYVTKPLDPFTLRTRLLVALRVTSLHAQLAHYREELAQQARTDPLTQLHNRLKLTEDLNLLHSRSERYGRNYSVALCDVDYFKTYNDAYGHPAGDQALKAVAATLKSESRHGDGIYRYGGEEFLLVLPDQAQSAAAGALERIRAAVQKLGIEHADNPAGVLTISAGVSTYAPGQPADGEQLLKEADVALYAAKAAGRNRVTLTGNLEQSLEQWARGR